jgi:hypothetical protein
MIYGTKHFNNGAKVGYLNFNTGKRVFLNKSELIEFKQKIKNFIYQDKAKERRL